MAVPEPVVSVRTRPEQLAAASLDLGAVRAEELAGASDQNGFLDAGETASVSLAVRNYVTNPSSAATFTDVGASVTSITPGVTVLQGQTTLPALSPGATATSDVWLGGSQVSKQRFHDARFVLEVHFGVAKEYRDGWRVLVLCARPKPANQQVDEPPRYELVPFLDAIDRPGVGGEVGRDLEARHRRVRVQHLVQVLRSGGRLLRRGVELELNEQRELRGHRVSRSCATSSESDAASEFATLVDIGGVLEDFRS
jgi:hypothetical protein